MECGNSLYSQNIIYIPYYILIYLYSFIYFHCTTALRGSWHFRANFAILSRINTSQTRQIGVNSPGRLWLLLDGHCLSAIHTLYTSLHNQALYSAYIYMNIQGKLHDHLRHSTYAKKNQYHAIKRNGIQKTMVIYIIAAILHVDKISLISILHIIAVAASISTSHFMPLLSHSYYIVHINLLCIPFRP